MEEQNTDIQALRAEAVSLGLPEAAANTMTEEALGATITALKATKLSQPEPTQPVEAPSNPVEEKEVEVKWKNKAEHMRALLEKQPKVRILVPLEGQEKVGRVEWELSDKTKRQEQIHISGAVQPVTLNGYTYLVAKGVYVDVPQQIADVITAKLQQTTAAGQNLLLDREDPQTGRSVRDQLS